MARGKHRQSAEIQHAAAAARGGRAWLGLSALTCGAAAMAATSAGAVDPRPLPDFTINRADSVVWGEGEGSADDIGCGFSDFLTRGFIAIKNIGDGLGPRLRGQVIYTVTNRDDDEDGAAGSGPIRRLIEGASPDAAAPEPEPERGGQGPLSRLIRGADEELAAEDEAAAAEESEAAAQAAVQAADERAGVRRVVRRKFVWAQVYNPYNPDLSFYVSSDDFGPENLGPLDQKRFEFTLGQDRLKKYRNFTGQRYDDVIERSRPAGAEPSLLDVQFALAAMGFDVTPDGVDGPKTTEAVIAYQASLGDEQTGELTGDQKAALMATSVEGSMAGGARTSDSKVDIYIVIDPFNVIREANEANNIQKWEVSIDCSIEDSQALSAVLRK